MKLLAYLRFNFTGDLWLPMADPNSTTGEPVMTKEKEIRFNFMDDPNAPRQIIVAEEPFPTTSQVMAVKDRRGEYPIPGAIWTVTSIEPVISTLGTREVYRHQVALAEPPNFGYDIVRTNA